MTKIALRLPSGLEVDFEGDDDAFAKFTRFVSQELPAVLEKLDTAPSQPKPDEHDPAPGERGQKPDGRDALDAKALDARLKEVGATSDIERITVIAQAAIDAGLQGLDYGTVDRLYQRLSLKKPKTWRATFSNAKQKGYIENVGQGLWRPTIPGENFARYGHRASVRKASRRSARQELVLQPQDEG